MSLHNNDSRRQLCWNECINLTFNILSAIQQSGKVESVLPDCWIDDAAHAYNDTSLIRIFKGERGLAFLNVYVSWSWCIRLKSNAPWPSRSSLCLLWCIKRHHHPSHHISYVTVWSISPVQGTTNGWATDTVFAMFYCFRQSHHLTRRSFLK